VYQNAKQIAEIVEKTQKTRRTQTTWNRRVKEIEQQIIFCARFTEQ
jgi:hypothetical protein